MYIIYQWAVRYWINGCDLIYPLVWVTCFTTSMCSSPTGIWNGFYLQIVLALLYADQLLVPLGYDGKDCLCSIASDCTSWGQDESIELCFGNYWWLISFFVQTLMLTIITAYFFLLFSRSAVTKHQCDIVLRPHALVRCLIIAGSILADTPVIHIWSFLSQANR